MRDYKQKKVFPKRQEIAIKELKKAGFEVFKITNVEYSVNGWTYFPNTFWFRKKSVQGRGIHNFIRHLKKDVST